MQIAIQKLIMHIMDVSLPLPILSNYEMALNNDINDYVASLIEKSFLNDDAKECEFKGDLTVWEQCKKASWDLTIISKSIAEKAFNIMRRNPEIPNADILMGYSQIDGSDYLFMLKLDYKGAFTHHVNMAEDGRTIDIIQHKTILPTQAAKITEGFFIKVQSSSVKVIEKKYMVDGIKDFYISTQILNCSENITPRQKATKILKIAEKVGGLYYSAEDEFETHISSVMLDEMQDSKPLQVEKLGDKFFPKNPVAKQEFFDRLSAAEIEKDETLTLSEKFQKKFEKQAIRTNSGVEIKIPTKLYSNSDEIEFINNPDGTVSLLIKNIKI